MLYRPGPISDTQDEGRKFHGRANTDGSGNWTFDDEPLDGPNITATATDGANNTSEFSAPFTLPSPTSSPTPSPSPSQTPAPTGATPSHTPGGRLQGDADCDRDVDLDDVVLLLSGIAGGGFGNPCNSVAVLSAGSDTRDVGCDGSITPVDALDVLLDLAGLPELPLPTGCADVGQPIG